MLSSSRSPATLDAFLFDDSISHHPEMLDSVGAEVAVKTVSHLVIITNTTQPGVAGRCLRF